MDGDRLRAGAGPLTRTLAAAFADGPPSCHLLPPGVRARDERLRRAFAVDCARSLAYGGLWTAADGDAAAVRSPHGHWRGPRGRIGASGRDRGSAQRCCRRSSTAATAERVPACLEGTCQRDVPLYRRHGFVEHGTLDVPGAAPPMTPVWRDPR